MIYAVIDTNVLVSAYITKKLTAATSKVWAAVLQGKSSLSIVMKSSTNIRMYYTVKNSTSLNI